MQIRTTRKKIKTRMKGKIKSMAKRYQLKTKKTKRGNVLLLDGKYICYRNYFGISQANLSHKDMRTGITYGFLNTLKSLLGNFAPVENVVIAWDIPTMGKSIRRKEFPMYKINPNAKEYTEEEKRNKIIFEKEYSELIEAVDQLGFASYGKERYEADDFIALFCNQFKNNHNIIIITRDEDIYQCLDTNVTMYSPDNKKKKTLQWFHKEFGILPNEWYMIKAIGGCKSDQIPGVPGVGEITAVKYLKGKASKNKTKKIREDYWKNTVQRNIPLVKLPHKSISETKLNYKQTVVDTDKFIDFCDDLGFASFITNIDKFQSILE